MANIAEKLAYLEAVIGADITQFRKGMRDIRNETGILSETMRGVAGFGRTLTFAYTTPLLVLGTTALQTATEFEAAMYNINSIAGLSADQLAALSAQTLEFGKTTRSGAIASAEALYTVFSAGIMDTTDAFALMNTAVLTSEAGLANLETTTNGMIAVMLSYGDTSEEMAQRTSDNITRMVQVGVGSMDAFVSSIGGLAPAAVAAGMEMEEWGADMAFLTQRGLSAQQAGISLTGIIEKMISPTEAMQGAFRELGADSLPELVTQFGSVNEVIEALINNTDGDMQELFAMFNTRQARRGIAQFAMGADMWQQAQQDFDSAVEGATGRAWAEQMNSFAASWDLLKSAVQGAGIAIGSSMFPVLQPLISMLTDFINHVSSASPELIGMTVAFLAVSAAIPPLLWLFGSLISPLGLIIGGLAALSIAFETNFGGIRDTVVGAVGGIVDDLQPLITAVDEFWTTLFPEDLQTAITGGTEPVEVDPYDYIIVTEPKSLWDVYVENGYDQQFSWQEFMDEALAGGWQGGVVTPDEPIRIRPNIEFEFMASGSRAEDAGLRQIANTQIAVPDSIIVDPFTQAMTVALPKVQKAFFDFIAGVVPSASEAAGWVSGKIAAFLFDAVTAGITYVFSGQALADTSVITNWIGDNVVDPFITGITSGLEGTNLQTAITGVTDFVTQLTDQFDFESVDLSGFTALTDGISQAVSSLAAADWSGVAKLGVILGLLAGDIFARTLSALNSISAGLGLIISSFGDGIANLVNAFAAAGNGDLIGTITGLSGAILDFGVALLGVPAGIIDALVAALGDLLGLEGLPNLTEWLEGIRTEIDEGLAAVATGSNKTQLDAFDFVDFSATDTSTAVDTINNAIGGSLGRLDLTAWWLGAWGNLPKELVVPEIPNIFDNDMVTQSLQNLNAIISDTDMSEATRLLANQVRDTFIAEMQAQGIPIPPEAFITPTDIVLMDGTVIHVNNPEIAISGDPMMPPLPPAEPTEPAELVVDWTFGGMTLGGGTGEAIPTDETVTVAPATVNLEPVALAFGEAILSGEDAQTIIDANFVPISDAWIAMFAADGLMATTFGTFSTGVTTGWTTISAEVTAFNDNLGVVLPQATGALTTATTTWSGSLGTFVGKVQAAQSAVNSLVSAIKQLMSMQGSFSIDVNVTGSLEPDGSHKGGLDYVPYDGYIAELHEGERVLTKEENREASMPASTVAVRDTSAARGETHNTVNINGVQDVDRMLFELKRRGIKL